MVETILPGTYISVRDEGLISTGSIASGRIGIVGTASQGEINKVYLLSSITEAKEIFGDSDTWESKSNIQELTLVRALELIYNNGGQHVYAVRTADQGEAEDYENSLALLENDIINIVVLAGQNSADCGDILAGHLTTTAGIKRERIGIIGSGFDADNQEKLDTLVQHELNSDRLIFTTPGIEVANRNKGLDRLPGAYTAAAVAGLIASLPVQASPTNKTLNIKGLTSIFNSTELEKLVQNRALVLEKRDGFRVVKGITTHDGAWKQITTRRIVDYAIYGVRSSCDPYIGKLNNERVRGAMKATLDAFLTRMVNDEALVSYQLSVSATRDQEKAGEAIVNLTLEPTFSIDFIKVTIYLG